MMDDGLSKVQLHAQHSSCLPPQRVQFPLLHTASPADVEVEEDVGRHRPTEPQQQLAADVRLPQPAQPGARPLDSGQL